MIVDNHFLFALVYCLFCPFSLCKLFLIYSGTLIDTLMNTHDTLKTKELILLKSFTR